MLKIKIGSEQECLLKTAIDQGREMFQLRSDVYLIPFAAGALY